MATQPPRALRIPEESREGGPSTGLFDLLFGSGTTDDWYAAADPGRAQAAADYQASAGGRFEPAPPPDLGQFDLEQHGGSAEVVNGRRLATLLSKLSAPAAPPAGPVA